MTFATPLAAANGSTVSSAPAPTPPAPAGEPGAVRVPPVQAGPPPLIVPNRRRLDNRYPVLAFNVRTIGRPWFEVLVATDRTLFSPDGAGRRTSANFYASRQHGGLSRADTEDVAYVVPASVLQGFVRARPRPAQVYYTVAAYPAPDVPPVFALPTELLVASAPSVRLGADFEAHTLATVLGVPVEKLRRVDHRHPASPGTMSVELDDDGIPVGGTAAWSSHDEQAAAEAAAAAAWAQDPSALSLEETSVPEPAPAAYSAPVESAEQWTALAADPLPLAEEQEWEPPAVADEDSEASELDYDDGYGSIDQEPWERQQESEFPTGAAEPAELVDDRDHVDADLHRNGGDQQHSVQAEYGDEAQGYDAYAAGDYDDEARAYESSAAGGYDDEAQAHDSYAYGDAGQDYEAETAAGPDAGVTALAPGATPPVAAVHPAAAPHGSAAAPATPFLGPALTEEAKVALLHKIGRRFESGRAYRACQRDFEFHTPSLPQYQRWHVGLTYGFFGFTQDSGSLGHLLQRFKTADAATFARIFGQHADELIAVTTAHGPEGRHSPGGRSNRVRPVAGYDLWEDEWVHRFEAAGDVPAFQREQDLMAVAAFVDPLLPLARAFGMDTERALGMLVDRAGHQGVGGAMSWLLLAINPLQADAVRQQALSALGFPGVREFQHAHGLHVDGEFGALTQIALADAVRRLGHSSPVPFPTREQLMDMIVAAGEHQRVWWRRRPHEMRTAPEFGDAPFSLPEPHGR